MARQMTFAEIGTLYNSIANELQGGVTHQNQELLIDQVSTVQTQLQHLIQSGALNALDGVGNPAVSIVHAQNIADQMNFLKTEIGAFGTDTLSPSTRVVDSGIRAVTQPDCARHGTCSGLQVPHCRHAISRSGQTTALVVS